MREIKFRAWSKTNKKMLYRVLAGQPCSIVWPEEKTDWVNFDDACGVIEQFTGRKDKHGKEIYEGDVLRIELVELVEVVYSDYSTCFAVKDLAGTEQHFLSSYSDDMIAVIGNVHTLARGIEISGGKKHE